MDWGQEASLIEMTANPLKCPVLHFPFLCPVSFQYSTLLLPFSQFPSCTKFHPTSGLSIISFPFPGQLFFLSILKRTLFVFFALSLKPPPSITGPIFHLDNLSFSTPTPSIGEDLPAHSSGQLVYSPQTPLPLPPPPLSSPITQTCCNEIELRLGSLEGRCSFKGTFHSIRVQHECGPWHCAIEYACSFLWEFTGSLRKAGQK